jgi:hypothetical protein
VTSEYSVVLSCLRYFGVQCDDDQFVRVKRNSQTIDKNIRHYFQILGMAAITFSVLNILTTKVFQSTSREFGQNKGENIKIVER